MGMTDAQFDSYKLHLLRRLEAALKDIDLALLRIPTEVDAAENLRQVIEDINNELRKP